MSDDVEDQIVEAMGDDADLEPDDAAPEEPEAVEEETPAAPEPAEEEVDAAAQMVALDKYRERALKYLARNMDEVLGEDATHYLECPFCNFTNTPGFLHASPCPPALLGTVYEWTNTSAPDEYQPDSFSRACDKCNGLGEVKSGSKVRGQEALICLDCKGRGWVSIGTERDTGQVYAPNGPTATNPPPIETAAPMIAQSAELSPAAQAAAEEGYIVLPKITVS